uniref:Putative secreted peptide n=1 Tax=Anopheles braziliensis TaxID=58242 RepID=A0A2M3ZMB6_9DIPT
MEMARLIMKVSFFCLFPPSSVTLERFRFFTKRGKYALTPTKEGLGSRVPSFPVLFSCRQVPHGSTEHSVAGKETVTSRDSRRNGCQQQ